MTEKIDLEILFERDLVPDKLKKGVIWCNAHYTPSLRNASYRDGMISKSTHFPYDIFMIQVLNVLSDNAGNIRSITTQFVDSTRDSVQTTNEDRWSYHENGGVQQELTEMVMTYFCKAHQIEYKAKE